MEKDTQSRKWQLTMNNPADKGYTHGRIKDILSTMRSVIYYCMADEVGENGTYHTHLFICGRGGIRFSTLKKNFAGAHFEMCKGTAQENMEYVSKTGKWEKDRKHETCVPDTFEEYGEMPVERKGRRDDMDDLYSMIKDGLSNYEILEQMPETLLNLDKVEMARQTVVQEAYKDKWRDLEVCYIYGMTGTGKTRSVMERYGYPNVFRVTDYSHPFDNYRGQDVVIFEEFRSSIRLSDMLNYLDGYPLELPCRYANKYACFTKVFLISNVPLSDQYKDDKYENTQAFYRRIKTVRHHTDKGVQEMRIQFIKDGFRLLLDGEVVPFEKSHSRSLA